MIATLRPCCVCAVSAGTNLMLVDSTATHLAQLGALSSNGRSKTFDATADGYGRGEACIVFVALSPGSGLQPLAVLHGEPSYRACPGLPACLSAGPAMLEDDQYLTRAFCCSPDISAIIPCHRCPLQAPPTTRTAAAAG